MMTKGCRFRALVKLIVVAPLVGGGIHAARAGDAITLLPSEFTLTGSEARQTLLVQRVTPAGLGEQVTAGVRLTSSNPDVVRIEDGAAVPVADGRATVTARSGGETATAEVTVVGQDEPHRWNFRIHVESVLSKMGCNSGACHGAAAGKNGFKLSLRGYDPEADYFAITRHARGRRIVPEDPARSLLLLKPGGFIPHKGGLRFDADSKEYRVLSEWIAAGHPGPADDDPRLERLEIVPERVVLRPESTQQILVRAHFTDGHAEDVTRWAKYTSTNQTVAEIDGAGKVSVAGYGESAVVAWYLGQNVTSTVTVPYRNELPHDVFRHAERKNFIDDLVLEKLQRLNIPPSPLSSDEVFIRRAYLDTIGVLPTAEEVRRFLADGSADKRDRLVDHLLTRPEFVDYWAYKWSDLLLVTGARLRPKAVEAYYGWIRKQVEQNTPWDEFARGIVLAKGSTLENGAANFYSLHQDPQDMAETVSQAFLGMSIQCARCHDHPLEKWTNNQYYGFANLFARVRGKGWGGDFRSGDGNRTIFVAARGELIQPRTGRPQPPRPLDGEPIPFDSSEDRRGVLADWMTSPENPYFTRAVVNRVWANFLGAGIVEAVDDLRLTNPPSNEPLMAALADYLVHSKSSPAAPSSRAARYDLKVLMRLILTSATYQRSSRTVPGNEDDQRYYSHYYPRRMQAEVMLDALSQVTGAPTKFPDSGPTRAGSSTRALQLADANVESYFLETFGRPERIITCECERSAEPSMTQVLHIMNGETLNRKLAAEGNRISEQLSGGSSNEVIIEELYLSALSRYPSEREKSALLEVLDETDRKEQQLQQKLQQAFQDTLSRPPTAEEKKKLSSVARHSEKRAVLEDLYWSVLSSREFLFHR